MVAWIISTRQSTQPIFAHPFKMTSFDDDQVFKYLGKYQLDTKLALLSQQVIKDSQSANPELEEKKQILVSSSYQLA